MPFNPNFHQNMKKCNKCVLPENYSGLIIDKNGTCNLCDQNNEIDYLGEKQLIKDVSEITKQNKSQKYNCIVGFSGGRDSTYLLWYTVNVLKLKPIAVFVDSGLIPNQTYINVKNISKILGVKLVIKKHNYLLNSVEYSLKSWVKYPNPSTLVNLCNGCRYGIYKFINEEAEKRNINLILAGGTPFEKGFFKKNLISSNKDNHLLFIKDYAKLVIQNPSLILKYYNLKMQFLEYFTMKSGYISSSNKDEIIVISPFTKYIHWDEEIIDASIGKILNWKKNPELNSNYRGDCYVGIIRQTLYDIMLGYNDKEDNLSWLIRDNQITREEAFEKLRYDKSINIDTIVHSFKEIGVDYDTFISEFEKNIAKYQISIFKEIPKRKKARKPNKQYKKLGGKRYI